MPTTYAIIKGNQYMDATTYSGTGAAANVTNAAGFYPDLTWVKNRSSGDYWNVLFDSVRGAGNQLSSNQTDAELASASNVAGKVSAFNSNGFGLAAGSSSILSVNGTSNNYVGWQWTAGQGANVTNTTGTITSTVSANTTAGFSVVTYTGNGTSGATFGHGLGVAPSFVIFKSRSAAATYWLVYSSTIGNASYLSLQTTDAAVAGTTTFLNSTTPTSSLITLGNGGSINSNGATYVAYCWTPIPGFSQFGSYTGNGSTDGTFVYLGFKPKFVMIKRTNTTGNWIIFDSARGPYNLNGPYLYANASDAEATSTSVGLDFLSNGFKNRNTYTDANANGSSYTYMAWAETPFKYANAR
jgi:hypothetical protein